MRKMKIIIPIAGNTEFKDSVFQYPKPLIDIDDKPLIQYVINNFYNIDEGKRDFIFIVKEELCYKYNLDYVIKQLSQNSTIIKIKGETRGAVCSILMAIDFINEDDEIIIINSDQYFLTDISVAIKYFRDMKADGGIIIFESAHPRWSFAQIDEFNSVYHTAEKKPISKNAIAGLYYFKKFGDFLESATLSILNEEYYDGQIYTSSTINQLILRNKLVKAYKIDNEKFISFYTPQKIKDFEKYILREKNKYEN